MAHEGKRESIWRVSSGSTEVLLAAAHLPSKLHCSDKERYERFCKFADLVRYVEAERGHRRTVVVGDFNADPFDDNMLSATTFHAVMTRERAARNGRTWDGKPWPYFYNPMWGRFGDSTAGPPGTYHYAKGGLETQFWHIFDQVLLRPELAQVFRDEDIEVLDHDGVDPLHDGNGYPDAGRVSDHFPVLVRLRTEEMDANANETA